jgi:hypothetical protein
MMNELLKFFGKYADHKNEGEMLQCDWFMSLGCE